MSAFGTKRHAKRGDECPLLGVKRTLDGISGMSAYDPKRTLDLVRAPAFTFEELSNEGSLGIDHALSRSIFALASARASSYRRAHSPQSRRISRRARIEAKTIELFHRQF
jgi:hypothetical protein